MDVHLAKPGGAAPERRSERRALPQSGTGLFTRAEEPARADLTLQANQDPA